MDSENLKALAITGALLFAAYKFGPGPVKAGALAVAAVVVAKRVPFVQNSLA